VSGTYTLQFSKFPPATKLALKLCPMDHVRIGREFSVENKRENNKGKYRGK
jgi:hypothetical protein